MRKCLDCPASLEGFHHNRKYCDECLQRKYEERKKAWSRSCPDWYRKSPENQEIDRARSLQRSRSNPERGRDYSKQYKKDHPDKVKAQKQRYRERKKG